jgi:WD40 repeat protein
VLSHWLDISPDNRHLVASGAGGATGLWDLATGQELRRFPGHASAIVCISFSPDGRQVFTVGNDGTILLWNVEPQPELPTLIGHQRTVSGLDLSADGRYLATAGGSDDTLRVWDAKTGEVQQVLTGTGSINYGMRFSPDGLQIVTASTDGKLALWDWRAGLPVYEWNDSEFLGAADVSFSPDGLYLAVPKVVSAGQTPYVLIADRSTGEEVFRLEGPAHELDSVAFSPDGRYLAAASQTDAVFWMWDFDTRELVREFNGHEPGSVILQVKFSPDGRYLATASTDGTARLWDAATGQEIQRLVGHNSALWGVAISPDSSLVATASVDRTARLWEVATGQELRRYAGHADALENVVFSADGRRLITVSDDGTGRFWDVDIRDTVRYLCSRLLRDLSEAEREQYGIRDAEPTCPP